MSKVERVREIIAQQAELEAELAELVGEEVREKRTVTCSVCKKPGHRATTCPEKMRATPGDGAALTA